MAQMVRLPPGASNLSEKTCGETIPSPEGLLKILFKTPSLLYRLALGFLVGRLFMGLTTSWRKSSQPRRTAVGLTGVVIAAMLITGGMCFKNPGDILYHAS